MPKNEGIPGSQRNVIRGTGNIVTGGTFTDSQVSATTVNAPQNPLVQQLQRELNKVRECLAGVQAPTADHEDAMKAVVELQNELGRNPDPDQGGLRRLRVRVRQVIGVLAPVAGIIGGVDALENICRHL
jgi:hypothetical protein